MPPCSLLVFSHLRWNFVYQRPQQLLTRLSRHYPVIYFEEPEQSNGDSYLETSEPHPGVLVCRPRLPSAIPGFHDSHIDALQALLKSLLAERQVVNFAVWFYTPMALPLMDTLHPQAVIYDCMDELSAFLNAPKQLLQRENALLKQADVVFTGGPSLFRSKRLRHPSVHCFPSSVDADHFASAGSVPRTAAPRPHLGFYGVIDERIDLDLIAYIADSQPDWQLTLVGPVVKISEKALPRRPNIEYLWQRDYLDLPTLVAAWDVCLLPFARNEATRYISPTKTLEYMAAGKPIVSTPIADVVDCYANVVSVAATADAFVSACAALLDETAEAAGKRLAAMAAILAKTSWDITASEMRALVDAARASNGQAHVDRPPREANIPSTPRAMGERETIIIGAGPTGLSAAYHLGKDSLLLEAGQTPGGWCKSIFDNGFTFDYAGHIMFSNDPYVHEMYQRLLGDNVHWQDREAWIYSKEVYTRYPFQGALYGLPPAVLTECIVGAIEARFGSIGDIPSSARRTSSTCAGKAESLTDCCADGSVDEGMHLTALDRTGYGGKWEKKEPKNFEEFIHQVWGAGVARHFAIPYNRKLWAVPLKEMETSWLGGRVPLPNLQEMIEGALQPSTKPVGPNARFGYPLRGGFQALVNGFLPLLEGEIELNAQVVKVFPSRHQVLLEDGRCYRYKQLISTAPLPTLVKMAGLEAPEAVRDAAAHLRHVSVRCVNLGVAREGITEKHWIYYPEDTVFHRIFVQGNASPYCSPPGGTGLTCEITYSPSKPLPCSGDALIDLCIADCIRVGLLRKDDKLLARHEVDMPYAYVVYDHARKENFKVIKDWFSRHDVILAGRYSEWQYYNSDHAFLAGKAAADKARACLKPSQALGAVTA